MKNCPFCKAQIEDNARFCLYCMSPLSEKKAAKRIKPFKKGWQVISAALLVFTSAVVLLLSAGEKRPEPTLNYSQVQTQTGVSDIIESELISSEKGNSDKPSGSSDKSSDKSTDTSSVRSPIIRPHFTSSNSSDGYSSPEYEIPDWYQDLFGTSSISDEDSSSSSSASNNVNSVSVSVSSKISSAIPSTSSRTSTSSKASTSTASNVTLSDLTEGYYTYSVTNGKATITDVRENKISGAVTIPSKLGGYAVVSVGESSFRDCKNITSLVIPEGITHIGEYAFSGCSAIKSVVIPNSIYRIDMEAFSGCDALIDINLPDKIISIGDSAFSSTGYYHGENWEANDTLYLNDYLIATYMTCTSRCEPKEGTKVLIDLVYYGCELKSFKLPESLVYIGEGAFYRCSGLTSITIPGHVKYIGESAFAEFESLENVTIESGITTITAGMFYGCKNLETIKIPKSVTSIGMYAFSGCKYLTDVYYEGSKADRDKMLIDSTENSYLLNATWHYNS